MTDPSFFDSFRDHEVIIVLVGGRSDRGKLTNVGNQWLTMSTSQSKKQFHRIESIESISCVADEPKLEIEFLGY